MSFDILSELVRRAWFLLDFFKNLLYKKIVCKQKICLQKKRKEKMAAFLIPVPFRAILAHALKQLQ